jgi:hypothetical protein
MRGFTDRFNLRRFITTTTPQHLGAYKSFSKEKRKNPHVVPNSEPKKTQPFVTLSRLAH